MKTNINKKIIGKRSATIRKEKGYSQSELSEIIGIPRASLTQAELGKRSIDIIELLRLSQVLHFSIDDLLSSSYEKIKSNKSTVLNEPITEYPSKKQKATTVIQSDKIIQILLYIMEKCAGKPNVGETVLNKLLYFSDFNYYEKYETYLTGFNYKKMSFGPVPIELEKIIAEMLSMDLIKRIKVPYHGFTQTRFIPLQKCDLTFLLASEKDEIDQVIFKMSDWTAAMISAYSHQDLPWEITPTGKEIKYELAFYREFPYSVRSYPEENE